MGNIDPTAFICNRATLLLCAALSCNPTSRGVDLAKTAGNLAISEVSGAIALQAERMIARQVVKSGSSAVAQKTAMTAEKYMVKGATPYGRGAFFSKDGFFRGFINQEYE